MPVCSARLQRMVEAVEEQRTIRQLGQFVVERSVLHLQFHPLARAHVEEDIADPGPAFDRGERYALFHVVQRIIDDHPNLERDWRQGFGAPLDCPNDEVHVVWMHVSHEIRESPDVSNAIDGLSVAEREGAVLQVGFDDLGGDPVEQVLESLTGRRLLVLQV